MQLRSAVITGGSAGIGFETARALAEQGFEVVLAARDVARAHTAAERIRDRVSSGIVRTVRLDLASLASVGETAAEILDTCARLDLLINNAGVMDVPFRLTEDGFESTFAT